MTDKRTYLICGCFAVVILLIDLSIPLGVASGVPYIIVILLSLSATNQRTTVFFAILCTLFITLGYFASPEGGVLWQVLFNRALAVMAVWVTAILALMQLKKERQFNEERIKTIKLSQDTQLQLEKVAVLKATMRTVLDIVGNFLNNLQYIRLQIETNKTLTQEELKLLDTLIHDTSSHLKKMAELESIKEKKMAGGLMHIDYEEKCNVENAP